MKPDWERAGFASQEDWEKAELGLVNFLVAAVVVAVILIAVFCH